MTAEMKGCLLQQTAMWGHGADGVRNPEPGEECVCCGTGLRAATLWYQPLGPVCTSCAEAAAAPWRTYPDS